MPLQRTLGCTLCRISALHHLQRLWGTISRRDPITLDLEKVAHHQFIDTHGFGPPVVNPYVISYAGLVTGKDGDPLRFVEGGLGVHKEARTSQRNALGRAICRTILEEYFNISRFWHVDDALRGDMPSGLSHLDISRAPGGGDAPDYLCVQTIRSLTRPVLAEAKGHQPAHGIGTEVWRRWQDQFSNVRIRECGRLVPVKGLIVATRLLEAEDFKTVEPDVRIEDPASPGDADPSDTFREELSRATVIGHYATVLSCLRLSEIADHIRQGGRRSEPFGIPIRLWECQAGQYAGQYFAGAKFPRLTPRPTEFTASVGQAPSLPSDGMDIVFFGLHVDRVEAIQSVIRSGTEAAVDLMRPFPTGEGEVDDLSTLSDGTVLGSLRHFEPINEPIVL